MNVIKLFDYQEDMKERIEKALSLHRSVMVQMPTGTGKTVLLASVVESFLREHSNCNVWIVAHRRELVSQIKDTLNKFLLNFNFSKITPSLFTLKEGSTSHPDPLTLRGEGGNRPQCYICPTCPSPAGGSLILNQAFPLTIKRKDVTALRCSEPLRSKVGGPSKVYARLCGMGPPGDRLMMGNAGGGSLQFIIYN